MQRTKHDNKDPLKLTRLSMYTMYCFFTILELLMGPSSLTAVDRSGFTQLGKWVNEFRPQHPLPPPPPPPRHPQIQPS